MGEQTAIAWCDHTFNGWIGCTKVSEGCQFCYAERESERHGWTGLWGPTATRRLTSDHNWWEPLRWQRKAMKVQSSGGATDYGSRVFCGSMMDWCDERAPEGALERLWQTITATPLLTWLLLTKRANRLKESLPANWGTDHPAFRHVWLGVSAENQERADERLSILSTIPAVVRFVSAEPLLGPLHLHHWRPFVDWVIVGGESGPHCRPCNLDWMCHLRDECLRANIALFVKQMGGYPDKRAKMEDLPSGLRIHQWPVGHEGR
jgi:protein gp37